MSNGEREAERMARNMKRHYFVAKWQKDNGLLMVTDLKKSGMPHLENRSDCQASVMVSGSCPLLILMPALQLACIGPIR